MPYFHGMPRIVAHDNYSITVLDGVGTKATFHYSLDDVMYKVANVERRIKQRNRNAAWAELRKNSVSISEDIGEAKYGPSNWNRPRIAGVFDSMIHPIPPGDYNAQILDVETTDFGLKVKMKVGEKEDLMSKHDSRNYPDKDYRFTAIAPQAPRSPFAYHGERQWFKTAAACQAFCEEVFSKEHPKSFALVIVEAKVEIEPKRKIEVTRKVFAK